MIVRTVDTVEEVRGSRGKRFPSRIFLSFQWVRRRAYTTQTHTYTHSLAYTHIHRGMFDQPRFFSFLSFLFLTGKTSD